MQTKNVNLLQANSVSEIVSVSEDNVMATATAPPLPPRGALSHLTAPLRPKSSRNTTSFLQQDESSSGVFSPYKPVPLPKPVPPPYRQPPKVPIYSNPTVPGTLQPSTSTDALNAQFPVRRTTQVLADREELEGDRDVKEETSEMRIPTLAEVVRMKSKPRSGNSVRPIDQGPKPKAQQAWTKDAQGDVEVPKPQKVQPIPAPKTPQAQNSSEGEPLLMRSRSGPLYASGIDNFGADNIEYVPSQPHQKSAGARGQVLLDRSPNEPELSTENLYRAICLTTEVDTIARGPEVYPPSSSQTIHSSLQNLKMASVKFPYGAVLGKQHIQVGSNSIEQLAQPYYHLKDMRSGDEEEQAVNKVYSRVSQLRKVEVEGVVVYGTTNATSKDSGPVDLCARSPAQGNSHIGSGDSKRISSTSSESGHGTMKTGVPSSSGGGTLNTSSEMAAANDSVELKIKDKAGETFNLNESSFSDHFSVTPPLPPLSPGTTPSTSPRLHLSSKHKRTPDIVETTRDGSNNARLMIGKKMTSRSKAAKSPPGMRNDFHSWIKRQGHLHVQNHSKSSNHSVSPYKYRNSRVPIRGRASVDTNDGEVTSTTTGLDVDSILDDVDLSSINSSTTDDASQGTSIAEIGNIRRQLESLEGMYSEVMKVLGLSNGVQSAQKSQESKFKKSYGNTSQLNPKGHLPSMIGGGQMGLSKPSSRHTPHERGKKPKEKGTGKRFQRLESHVVTLARSVAHLSSEMRTQHMMFQELETLRQEVAQLHNGQLLLRGRMGQGSGAANAKAAAGCSEWDNFRCSIPSLTNPSRVKKLTNFFGDEPPLLRLFLKKLGYEKYACLFESEKIGIIELPYLTEERLQKIGIPMGPRMRILQEAQMSFRQEHFNIYIV